MSENYPNLTEILAEIARDNGGRLRRRLRWPANAAALEAKAAGMTEDERITLAVGEETGQQEVYRRHGAADLNVFLNEAFDGALTADFYED